MIAYEQKYHCHVLAELRTKIIMTLRVSFYVRLAGVSEQVLHGLMRPIS